jgi:5'-deoxynucleotidase YfbR-like HD superfamily hydrolase
MMPTSQTWFQTFTGVKFYPLTCSAGDIRVEDIAHASSNYCRYGGHTRHFYSVAQHVCLCHDHMPQGRHPHFKMLRLQALLHDGTEGYLGDVVKPLKVLLKDYQRIERRLERIILSRYGLPTKLEPEVKEADLIALATEKRDLLYDGPIWDATKGVTPWPETIVPWQPAVAREQFLKRFFTLTKQPV